MMKRTAKRPKKPPYKVQVLDRAINIIEFIGQQSTGEAGLRELSLAMKLHKTTAHRIAHVLESRGLLRRGLDSNRYRLGLHLYDLGCQALDHVNIRDEARPFMTRIALEVGETVHLSVLQKTKVVYLDKVEPNRRVCMTSKSGTSNPVYCTSMGKAMLAFLPDDLREEVLGKGRAPAEMGLGGGDYPFQHVLGLPQAFDELLERSVRGPPLDHDVPVVVVLL